LLDYCKLAAIPFFQSKQGIASSYLDCHLNQLLAALAAIDHAAVIAD